LLDARTLSKEPGDGEEGIARQVTGLGIEHQLITPYTSFLAVDKTPSRPAGSPLASDTLPRCCPLVPAPVCCVTPRRPLWRLCFRHWGCSG
jgi:Ca-activated chloride channel family protein